MNKGIFNNYAHYYNLLYKEKDYLKEAIFISNIIKKHNPKAQNILDLGCGTGNHGIILSQNGYSVTGVDRSAKMIMIAKNNFKDCKRLKFIKSDIRTVTLNTKYDAVISLFHVMSYLTTNADLCSVFKTVKKHLKDNGIFIFDCWYGPAVLANLPKSKTKYAHDDKISIKRYTKPILYPDDNLVEIGFQTIVKDRNSLRTRMISENHCMRYLFKPEIEDLAKNVNLKLFDFKEWLTNKKAGLSSWSTYFVLKNTKI